MLKFCVRQWSEESAQYGEKQWLYDLPANNLADDADDARAKAAFSFEDAGVTVEWKNDTDFITSEGDEYRMVTTEA